MSKTIDNFAAMLKARADQNGDSKLDRKDIEIIAARARAQVLLDTQKYPWGTLCTVAVLAATVGAVVGRLTGAC